MNSRQIKGGESNNMKEMQAEIFARSTEGAILSTPGETGAIFAVVSLGRVGELFLFAPADFFALSGKEDREPIHEGYWAGMKIRAKYIFGYKPASQEDTPFAEVRGAVPEQQVSEIQREFGFRNEIQLGELLPIQNTEVSASAPINPLERCELDLQEQEDLRAWSQFIEEEINTLQSELPGELTWGAELGARLRTETEAEAQRELEPGNPWAGEPEGTLPGFASVQSKHKASLDNLFVDAWSTLSGLTRLSKRCGDRRGGSERRAQNRLVDMRTFLGERRQSGERRRANLDVTAGEHGGGVPDCVGWNIQRLAALTGMTAKCDFRASRVTGLEVEAEMVMRLPNRDEVQVYYWPAEENPEMARYQPEVSSQGLCAAIKPILGTEIYGVEEASLHGTPIVGDGARDGKKRAARAIALLPEEDMTATAFSRYVANVTTALSLQAEEVRPEEVCLASTLTLAAHLLSARERWDQDALERQRSEHLEWTREHVSSLDERSAETVRLRYGIDRGGQKLTLADLGEALGVTRERAQQLEVKALEKLSQRADGELILKRLETLTATTRGGGRGELRLSDLSGLVLLSHLFERFESCKERLESREAGDPTDPREYAREGVYWMPPKSRWDELSSSAHGPELGERLDAAVKELERENPELRGVLPRDFSRDGLDQRRLGKLFDLVDQAGFTRRDPVDQERLVDFYRYFTGGDSMGASGSGQGSHEPPAHRDSAAFEL